MTIALAPPRAGTGRVNALLLVALLALTGIPAVSAAANLVPVIVTGGSVSAATAAVHAAGGTVDAPLPLIDGAVARVPEDRLAGLAGTGVTAVPDRPITFQSSSFDDDAVAVYAEAVGAHDLWAEGTAGAGVTVALVDTGVAGVPDLAERVIASADFSGEGNHLDTYGHGTVMAGIIAGDGTASGGRFTGVAPEANLVSIKVAGADGSTSLGRVLHGLQAVESAIPRFGVRILLLALDSGSPLPPEIDPLSVALRRLWARGVLVVVPAGNGGPEPGTIASPGEDPALLTAGAVDDQGTAEVADDTVPDFTARGPTRWGDPKPDLAAPGVRIIAARSPGSTIDENHPNARIGDAYIRGSGTSMSAAVTAGAAALVLQARPDLVPDAAKASLMGSADPILGGDAWAVGAGVVNAADAVAIGGPSDLPEEPEGDELHFEPPGLAPSAVWVPGVLGSPSVYEWDARRWAQMEAAARRWAEEGWEARRWAARRWAEEAWEARRWAARRWAEEAWEARRWADEEWAARRWADEEWAARRWAARRWADEEWAARRWAGETWEARRWAARRWADEVWEARRWMTTDWE